MPAMPALRTPTTRPGAPAAARPAARTAALRGAALPRAAAPGSAPSVPAGAESGRSPTARVTFSLKKKVPFGQTVAIVGDGQLGGWSPAQGVRLQWREGDEWVGDVETGAGSTLEYKLVVVDGAGRGVEWQAGPNRTLDLGAVAAPGARVVVGEAWAGQQPAVEVVAEDGAAVVEEEVAVVEKIVAEPALEPAPVAATVAIAVEAAAAPVVAAFTAAPAPSPVPTPPPAPAAATASNLSALNVKELKARCKAAGLPTTGKKGDLVARLRGTSA